MSASAKDKGVTSTHDVQNVIVVLNVISKVKYYVYHYHLTFYLPVQRPKQNTQFNISIEIDIFRLKCNPFGNSIRILRGFFLSMCTPFYDVAWEGGGGGSQYNNI